MRIAASITILFAACFCGCDRFTPAPQRPPAQGPLRVHASNPRYLDDGTGKAVVLAGSHTWANLQDDGEDDPPEAFDFDAYLQMLVDHHHNFIRLWRWETPKYRYAGDKAYRFCAPHPWVRSGATLAQDGKPKFDLSTFDEDYFRRLRERVQTAGQRGIYVGVMLFEGHALSQAEQAWFSHPLNAANNLNGINGDTNGDGRGLETQMLGDSALLAVQESYVRKVIETVNDLDNVLYEIGNECHADSDAWQRHMIEFVQHTERSLPKQHLVIYSAPVFKHGDEMWDSTAEVVAPGKKWVGNTVPLQSDPPATDGSKVVMLDTDHLWGCGGDAPWVFKAFLRGYHPIYMDPWQPGGACGKPNQQLRRNLGYALRYADRIDLAQMTPRADLASSRFCLANPGNDYLVYLPQGGAVDIDLRDSTALVSFTIEWFSPGGDETRAGGICAGGAVRTLRAPFSGDALLYLRVQN